MLLFLLVVYNHYIISPMINHHGQHPSPVCRCLLPSIAESLQ